MREVAEELGVPVLMPQDINSPEAADELSGWPADLLLVCDYGQILSPEVLALVKHGGLNLHGSLLPSYRGAAPVNWAIYHGDKETGVTVIHMTPKLDGGPCVGVARTSIERGETAVGLEQRLSEMGAPLTLDAINHLEAGELEAIPQDPAAVTKAPKLKKSDGLVDWNRCAIELFNQVRAFQPWPTTFTYLLRERGEPLRVILEQVEYGNEQNEGLQAASPGTVVVATSDQLHVATGRGLLKILRIQPSGKRVLSVEEFLRGYPVAPGERFGA